jgi:hypothetical protein
MPSKSRARFDENCKDVERLLQIHLDLAGNTPGRKYGVAVLNKSAIVMICAYWEAYNEDVLHEAIEHVAAHAASADRLPPHLREVVAKTLRSDQNKLAVWDLAGDGWRKVLTNNLQECLRRATDGFNTPKSGKLEWLFRDVLGIQDITTGWKRRGRSSKQARDKIDKYVSLRGDVAHRGASGTSVQKAACTDFLALVRDLVSSIDAEVNQHVNGITQKPLFPPS